MPAQKRPAPPSPSDHLPSSDGSPPPPPSPPPPTQQQKPQHQQRQEEREQLPLANQPQDPDDTDGEGGSPSSPGAADNDEFILVKLADIRKEVQCPICLGIIRKTRTVMECLHRFCRECIDKSMRLGNNECPACRTHCASRRSLRDDANYDSLIAALYPDIDKYEEEELALHEEEKTRNRKFQECIAETLRRQSEALGRRRSTAKATAAAFVRKSQGNFRSGYPRGRGRSAGRDAILPGSDDDDDEDEANGNDCGKDSSSAEERSPEVRRKRRRRWTAPRSSPVRAIGSPDVDCEESDSPEMSRENRGTTSPLRAGNREMLAWGKGGARSQTRHGNSSGLNGRFFKSLRMAKLVEYLRNLDENDDEFEVHLTLLPLDEQSVPSLQRPHLCCRPTLSIRHLCQFIAIQTSVQAEEIEILVRKRRGGTSPTTSSNSMGKALNEHSEELQILGVQESIARLHAFLSTNQGDLVLFYRLKNLKVENDVE